MESSKAPKTVDEYIAASPAAVRTILRKIRAVIRKAVPGGEERISYRMPTLFENGAVIYFAAFKEHIGLFPPLHGGDAKLRKELEPYRGEKGNLRFPLAEPIPYDLIGRFARARAEEQLALAARKRTKK